MQRRWNVSMWVGFLLVLSAIVTYITIFIRFPATRDFPWATLLIFGAGLTLTARGLGRAYREPQTYRGKIAGPILLSLGIALFGFFCYNIFYVLRQLPPSNGAPQVGQRAPDFTLPDQHGDPVTLSKLLDSGAGGEDRVNGVVLVFYRGYW
jgi:hypothetical protein